MRLNISLARGVLQKSNRIFILLFTYLAISLSYSCNQKNASERREFFRETKESYYDKSLDSLGLLGSFGISSSDTLIESKKYWKINNTKPNFLLIQGFLRYDNGIVYLKPLVGHSNIQSVCEDQALFSFEKDEVGKKKPVFYICNAPLILADSVELQTKIIDSKSEDTLYTYILKSFFLSNTTKDVEPLFNTTLVTVSRDKGIIDCTFTTGIDSIKVRFYPSFSRLDSNYFRRKMM
jgi:hypothetical protein